MSRPRESNRIHNDENGAHGGAPTGKYLLYLALGALGVVYGDIGTSPLYAFRESFHASYGIEVRAVNILGILSLIFWSLILVISVKYLVFVMRADNNGEGGILALTALIGAKRRVMLPGTTRWVLVMMGLFGTALLYGDGMITPAISVLSAVEGLEVVTPFFEPYVIPITVIILVGLFSVSEPRHRAGRQGLRSRHARLVPGARHPGHKLDRAPAQRARRGQSLTTRPSSSSKTACAAFSCWARSSWW